MSSFEATKQRQLRRGLEMTPAERLQWLERQRAEFKRLQGLARAAEARVAAERPKPPETP